MTLPIILNKNKKYPLDSSQMLFTRYLVTGLEKCFHFYLILNNEWYNFTVPVKGFPECNALPRTLSNSLIKRKQLLSQKIYNM